MGDERILVGVQLSGQGAQLTWYGQGVQKPQTLSLPGENREGCLPVPEPVWLQLRGTGQGSRNSGEQSDLGLSRGAAYLKKILDQAPGAGKDPGKIRICVTVPDLGDCRGDGILAALGELGISKESVCLQDYATSFFYYVVNKKRDLWKGDVALLTEEDGIMKGYLLQIDRTKTPWQASFHQEVSADGSDAARGERGDEEWNQERDRLLYDLLGKLFERRTVTSCYLYGTGFDASWAGRSFQYLTFHRHAFQGQNLFSKGACYGAMARFGLQPMPDLVFQGRDRVRHQVGLMVRIRGKNQYLPLIYAGSNWFEAHGSCELIPEGEKSLLLLSSNEEGGDRVGHILRLDHFPVRPDRATRLRLSLSFSEPGLLEAKVRDLGFGTMYPATGKVWTRRIRLGEEN